jgi:type VI secretion system protein ImpF
MAQHNIQERLQPALLDRLTDLNPDRQVESRENRVISLEKLRECVLRDLGWLFNRGCLSQLQDLEAYPHVAHSVLNYGTPDLTGLASASADVSELEQMIRQSILDFEPRILRNSVKVRAVFDGDKMNNTTLAFEIEGALWAEPTPMRLFLKTEIDLETGRVDIRE